MKKVKTVCLLVGVGIAGLALAQPHPSTKKRQGSPAVDNEPVSCAEARATFKKVSSLFHVIAQHEPAFGGDTLPDSDNPVTREQVMNEFDRLFQGLKPYFKFTPRPQWYDPSVVSIAGPAKTSADRMIKWGFVERVGPLATSKQPTISVSDFGDSVGVFIARAADLTHMPMPDYSPYLEKQ